MGFIKTVALLLMLMFTLCPFTYAVQYNEDTIQLGQLTVYKKIDDQMIRQDPKSPVVQDIANNFISMLRENRMPADYYVQGEFCEIRNGEKYWVKFETKDGWKIRAKEKAVNMLINIAYVAIPTVIGFTIIKCFWR